MPFYMGIDINIYLRVCARHARAKHPTVSFGGFRVNTKTVPLLCVYLCACCPLHTQTGQGRGPPSRGMHRVGLLLLLFFIFFDFSVVLVLCLSMLFAIIIAQPRFYGFFMPYFRFKSFLW